MAESDGIKRYPAEAVRNQIAACLTAWGMPQDQVETTADVMVATFREQAVAACQRDPTATGLADRTAWANPAQVWFSVGNPHADVSVWQVDHARWGERYRTPFIFIATAGASGGPVCAYDISARRTMVLPLGHS